MNIPLRIDGEEAGVMRVTKSGLYTVFEAELPNRAAELVRLWAHGKGSGAYLGVMQPHDGGLWFSRKLSRRELAGFPDPVVCVSDQDKLTENNLHNQEAEAETEQILSEEREGNLHNTETEADEDAANTEQEPAQDETAPARAETDCRACPWPAEPPEEGLLWYKRSDGSLASFDGISTLLALPAELRAPVPGAAVRVIEGKKYLVFRT